MIKSAPTLWRDTQMERAKAEVRWFKDVGALFGVSGPRAAQCITKRQRLRRVSAKRLAEFKTAHCEQEIYRIKRAYDRLTESERAEVKADWAAHIDMLLDHYRKAFAETGAVKVSTSR